MAVIESQELTASSSAAELQSLRTLLEEAVAQLANLSDRVAGLEQLASMSGAETGPVAAHPVEVSAPSAPAEPPAAETTSSLATASGITEEEVLAISAALAAWLGVHAHIRQIRLIRTGAWAQQGRVTIQASHRLHY